MNMVRAQNCSLSSDQFPLSSEIFPVIKGQIWIFLVPVVLGAVQVGLFLEETGFFLRQGGSSRRTTLSLWILGVYPVFSITSLIGLFVPRASFVCTFVASIYHSITLWKFLALIRDFFGGSEKMLQQVEGRQVSPNPFPCCCCCCLPEISASRVCYVMARLTIQRYNGMGRLGLSTLVGSQPERRSNLRFMTAAVYQLSLIRTVLFFVTLILWTDEKYDYGDVGYTNPNSYINAIIGISTFLSFYGYLLFYKATKPALAGYSLRSKFVCIILVLVLCGLQSGILETMGAVGAIPCSPPLSTSTRSQMIYYYALAVEMFFISIFARYSFRRTEPHPDTQLGTSHRASQTETVASSLCSPGTNSTLERVNSGFLGEEALCTIEHSPLDQFDFSTGEPVDKRLESWGPGKLRMAKEPRTRLSQQRTGIQIEGQAVTEEAEGITVV